MYDTIQQRRDEMRELGCTEQEIKRDELYQGIAIFAYVAAIMATVTVTWAMLLF